MVISSKWHLVLASVGVSSHLTSFAFAKRIQVGNDWPILEYFELDLSVCNIVDQNGQAVAGPALGLKEIWLVRNQAA